MAQIASSRMTAAVKKYLAIAGAIVLAIIAGLVVYGNYQRVMYQQALGASKVLTAEYNAYKQTADVAILAKTQEISLLAKEKQAAIDAADDALQSQSAIQAELDRLKRETAALPPDALSGNINAFIGFNNSWPTAGGLFSFTRPGAENALNIFYERDSYSKLYAAEQVARTNTETALKASDGQVTAWAEKYSLKDGEYTRALSAWAADTDALKHLQRSMLGRKIKSFAFGAGVGIIAGALIYHSLKD